MKSSRSSRCSASTSSIRLRDVLRIGHQILVRPRWRPHVPLTMNALLSRVDHLVYAAPDLDEAIEKARSLLGADPALGGSHPGMGTRNALVGLGPGAYLEIIGPDPDQPDPDRGRPFRIDELRKPVLVTWAVRVRGLAEIVIESAKQGLDLGEVREGKRKLPDGRVLSWRLTDPYVMPGDGVVPFFIDWEGGPHPSDDLAHSCRLVGLRGKHSNPGEVRDLLRKVDLDLPVSPGGRPRMVARVETGRGVVEVR